MLVRLPVEHDARIVDVPAAHRSELAGEGLRAGRTVRVTGRAPFGGPILLMVGRARLAVSRSVAAGILVDPGAEAGRRGGDGDARQPDADADAGLRTDDGRATMPADR
jgi:Fe2+ transport system protein FeoA